MTDRVPGAGHSEEESLAERVRLLADAVSTALKSRSQRLRVEAQGAPGRDGTLIDESIDVRVDHDVGPGVVVEIEPREGPKPKMAIRPVDPADEESVAALVLDIAQMFENLGIPPDATWRVAPTTDSNAPPVDEDWLESPTAADLSSRLNRLAGSRGGRVVIRLLAVRGPEAELGVSGSASNLNVRAQIRPEARDMTPPSGWRSAGGHWRRSWRLGGGRDSARTVLDDTLAALALDADVSIDDERYALAIRFESNDAARTWRDTDRSGCSPLILGALIGTVGAWVLWGLGLYPDTGMTADVVRGATSKRDAGTMIIAAPIGAAAAVLVAYALTSGLGRVADRLGLTFTLGTAMTNSAATVVFVGYFVAILTTPLWPWLVGIPLAPIAIAFGLLIVTYYWTEAIGRLRRRAGSK